MIQEVPPKVWVIKEQVKRTDVGAEAMDYSPAMKFGELEFITEFDMPFYPSSSVQARWQARVNDFCERYDSARDFIICTGQPVAIFMVGFMLANWVKKPRFLVWRREQNTYMVLESGISTGAIQSALGHHLGLPVEVK